MCCTTLLWKTMCNTPCDLPQGETSRDFTNGLLFLFLMQLRKQIVDYRTQGLPPTNQKISPTPSKTQESIMLEVILGKDNKRIRGCFLENDSP